MAWGRQSHGNGGAMPGATADFQTASQQGDPLAHALQPERLRLSHRTVHIESDTVIFDVQFQ